MDISSLMGGNKPPEAEKAPALEYSAQAVSPLINGEVNLTVGEGGLAATGLLDAIEIPYADMTALELEAYAVTIRTEAGDFLFSRMGGWLQPFYGALLEAYNKKVRKALFVPGNPLFTATCHYQYTEAAQSAQGAAPVQLYEDCICVLPPNGNARRIPLCFLTGLDKGDYALTLRLDTGNAYSLSKLGYDMAPLTGAIEKQLRGLREDSLAAVRAIDPLLSPAQASAIAKLMPEGVAAPMGKLEEIAPSFTAALSARLAESRAAETYAAFQKVSDPARIHVGFRKQPAPGGSAGSAEGPGGLAGMLGGLAGNESPLGPPGDAPMETAAPTYLLWLIAPSPDGNACAVEFAGSQDDAAATFVYRFDGGFARFAEQLNHALEAIQFKREIIRLPDAQLLQAAHADHRMAVRRNASLQFVRACFAGRSSTPAHGKISCWSCGQAARRHPRPQRKRRRRNSALHAGQKTPPAANSAGSAGQDWTALPYNCLHIIKTDV